MKRIIYRLMIKISIFSWMASCDGNNKSSNYTSWSELMLFWNTQHGARCYASLRHPLIYVCVDLWFVLSLQQRKNGMHVNVYLVMAWCRASAGQHRPNVNPLPVVWRVVISIMFSCWNEIWWDWPSECVLLAYGGSGVKGLVAWQVWVCVHWLITLLWPHH